MKPFLSTSLSIKLMFFFSPIKFYIPICQHLLYCIVLCASNRLILVLIFAALAGSDLHPSILYLTIMFLWKLLSSYKCIMLFCLISYLRAHLVLLSSIVRQILNPHFSSGIKVQWETEGTASLYQNDPQMPWVLFTEVIYAPCRLAAKEATYSFQKLSSLSVK